MARNKYPEVTINRILDVATELFLEKGYEYTTIQDIINALGDLSKGAIYHHFKSKDDIINAVVDRLYEDTNSMYFQIAESKELTGLEKLKQIFTLSVDYSKQDTIMKVLPNLLKNPKFLAIQLSSTVNELAPMLIEPLIRAGIEDGSLQTTYPKELAEVISILANVWLNPFIFASSPQELYQKTMFFRQLLLGMNVDLIDEALVSKISQLANATLCDT